MYIWELLKSMYINLENETCEGISNYCVQIKFVILEWEEIYHHLIVR